MLLGQELKFKNKLCNLKLGTFFSALPRQLTDGLILKLKIMIVSFKNGERVFTMENADLRSICGGTAVATQSFPCTVHESDGSVHTKEVSSVEECLEYGGLK